MRDGPTHAPGRLDGAAGVPRAPSSHPPSTEGVVHGLVVAGSDRPDLVERVLLQPTDATGCTAPVYVLEPDPARREAAVALGQRDPSRVRPFTGGTCVEDLDAFLRARLDCRLPSHVSASGRHTESLARQAAAALSRIVQVQEAETTALRSSLGARWRERTMSWWSNRFEAIGAGAGARVLVVTSRFSTFVRHSAADLVEALTSLGHDARPLMEPDEHTNITPLLCLRTIDEFDPDLIVVINYPRAMHASLFPEGWPHVCWVQDAMPHLFRRMSMTDLDFVAGHVYGGVFDALPERSRLPFPVPVSTHKFHDAPVDAGRAARFACDVAYVSHASQTPEAFHRAFAAHFAPAHALAFDACHARIAQLTRDWAEGSQLAALEEARRALASALNCVDDRNACDLLWHQYVHPLAERLLRHEMLAWAASIADRHGLSLRLYGHGWDRHPTLAAHAAGPVTHDEDLRACYQGARAHLHASMLGCGHQRVLECAMAGGLPLSLRSWMEMHLHDWARMTDFMSRNEPFDASLLPWRCGAYVIDRNAELRSIITDRGHMRPPVGGWDHELFADGLYAQVPDEPAFNYWRGTAPPQQMRPLSLFADPLALTFSTPAELEQRILRAVADDAWRQRHGSALARRARETVSMTCFASRLLELVAGRVRDVTPRAAETVG